MLYPLSYEGGGWRLPGRKVVRGFAGRFRVAEWRSSASQRSRQCSSALVFGLRACCGGVGDGDLTDGVGAGNSSVSPEQFFARTCREYRDETVWFTGWRHRLGGTKRGGTAMDDSGGSRSSETIPTMAVSAIRKSAILRPRARMRQIAEFPVVLCFGCVARSVPDAADR
jgi:hypothetical protein